MNMISDRPPKNGRLDLQPANINQSCFQSLLVLLPSRLIVNFLGHFYELLFSGSAAEDELLPCAEIP